MKQKKGRSTKRLEGLFDPSPKPPDPTVAEVYESEQHGHGERTGAERMSRERREMRCYDPAVQAGDVDARLDDAALVGEEAPGGATPTPDQDLVDEIGEALGVEYQAEEPLRPEEKLEKRDLHRWELNPVSAEDYAERSRGLRSPPRKRRR